MLSIRNICLFLKTTFLYVRDYSFLILIPARPHLKLKTLVFLPLYNMNVVKGTMLFLHHLTFYYTINKCSFRLYFLCRFHFLSL